MKTSVTERIPYEWFEVDAIEGWLDEHVRQGLRLVSVSPLRRALFVPSTGSLTRYRIHVKVEKDGSRDEEYREEFRELGWEFVAELHDQADIYQAIRPDAVEINTDEDVLRSVVDKEVKKNQRMALLWPLVIALWAWNLLDDIIRYPYAGIYDFLLSENALLFLLCALMLSVWVVHAVADVKKLRSVRRRYLLDRDYHSPTVIKRRRFPHRYAIIISVAVLVMCFVLYIWQDNAPDIRMEEFSGPTVTALFPGHEPSSYIPHSNKMRDEYAWKDTIPPLFSVHVRQYGTEQLSADAFDTRPVWTYNANIDTVPIESWAAKYAAEQAADRELSPIAFSGWENAWFAEETYQDNDGRDITCQQLLLQNSKTVWWLGYWEYTKDAEYDLLSAAVAYCQANR